MKRNVSLLVKGRDVVTQCLDGVADTGTDADGTGMPVISVCGVPEVG